MSVNWVAVECSDEFFFGQRVLAEQAMVFAMFESMEKIFRWLNCISFVIF